MAVLSWRHAAHMFKYRTDARPAGISRPLRPQLWMDAGMGACFDLFSA